MVLGERAVGFTGAHRCTRLRWHGLPGFWKTPPVPRREKTAENLTRRRDLASSPNPLARLGGLAPRAVRPGTCRSVETVPDV